MNKFYFLMIAVMMTACVGAINLPAGTITESKTEKPDETPDPKSIVIDDKEPEPKPKAKEVIETVAPEPKEVPKPKEVVEPEPKEVVEPEPKEMVESEPEEMVESEPKEMVESEPEEMVESEPKEMVESEPKEMIESEPEEMVESEPEEMVESEPKEMVESEPKEMVESEPKVAITPPNPCLANPFGSTCAIDFNPARELICANEPDSARCRPTIRRVCKTTPFEMVCQSRNLIRLDLPATPNTYFRYTGHGRPVGSCITPLNTEISNRCYGYIPVNINIKPLNNTNSGIATYNGQLDISYNPSFNHDLYANGQTLNMSLIVNFDDKTLSYTDANRVAASRFSINGNFTDRGIITGLAKLGAEGGWFGLIEAPLIGFIGQNKAIGIFAGASSRASFGGGFIATRQ